MNKILRYAVTATIAYFAIFTPVFAQDNLPKFEIITPGDGQTIYGNKVSIHILTDKPIIIIIKNKDVAKSYKSYFEFLWRFAKR